MTKKAQINLPGCGTCIFWVGILFLFINAHIMDDIVHGNENLMLGFGIPFWLMGTFGAIYSIRLIWYLFPNIAPHSSLSNVQKRNWQPVGIALLIAAILSFAWSRSPLMSILYDSIKIIIAIVLASVILGFIYRIGGFSNIKKSLFFAIIAGCIAFLIYIMTFVYYKEPLLLSDVWKINGMVGVPYTFVISLYDSYRRILQQTAAQDIKLQ